MMVKNREIGMSLKEIRKEIGYSKAKASKEIGINVVTLGRIESGYNMHSSAAEKILIWIKAKQGDKMKTLSDLLAEREKIKKEIHDLKNQLTVVTMKIDQMEDDAARKAGTPVYCDKCDSKIVGYICRDCCPHNETVDHGECVVCGKNLMVEI